MMTPRSFFALAFLASSAFAHVDPVALPLEADDVLALEGDINPVMFELDYFEIIKPIKPAERVQSENNNVDPHPGKVETPAEVSDDNTERLTSFDDYQSSFDGNFPDTFNYKFGAYGQDFDVILSKNHGLFSEGYKEIRVNEFEEDDEWVTSDTKAHLDLCHYKGTLRGEPSSMVSISLCSGSLEGSIISQGVIYAINSATKLTEEHAEELKTHQALYDAVYSGNEESTQELKVQLAHQQRALMGDAFSEDQVEANATPRGLIDRILNRVHFVYRLDIDDKPLGSDKICGNQALRRNYLSGSDSNADGSHTHSHSPGVDEPEEEEDYPKQHQQLLDDSDDSDASDSDLEIEEKTPRVPASNSVKTKKGCTCKPQTYWKGEFSHNGCNIGAFDVDTRKWCATEENSCNNGKGYDVCTPVQEVVITDRGCVCKPVTYWKGKFSHNGCSIGPFDVDTQTWCTTISNNCNSYKGYDTCDPTNTSDVIPTAPQTPDQGPPEADYTVEVLVVNDRFRYSKLGDSTEQSSAAIINFLDQWYRSTVGIGVSIAGQVTLSTDPFKSPTSGYTVQVTGYNGLLNNFNMWRVQNLNKLPAHDNGQLFSGANFNSNIVGLAEMYGMCTTSKSGAVNNINFSSTTRNAQVVAHEMGHNLGMNHDGDSNRCSKSGYLMASIAGAQSTKFSSCSVAYLENFFKNYLPYCLVDEE